LNALSSKILYISIDDFLKRTPDDHTIVIFDEVDQMVGNNSFNIIESDN
jgi:hypothetical protein